MIRRVPIRLRLALAFGALAALLLAAGMAAVYVSEQSEVLHVLADDARSTATSLAAVAAPGYRPPAASSDGAAEREVDDGQAAQGSSAGSTHAKAGGGGSPTKKPGATSAVSPIDARLAQYLQGRQGEGELLLVQSRRGGPPLANVLQALALSHIAAPPPGGVRTVRVGGSDYLLASARGGGRLVLAALPMAPVTAEVSRLARTALVVTAIGIVAAALLAWLISRHALRPLELIAERSSRITHGDLSVRMGDGGARDEISQVSAALDAMLDRLQAAFAAQTRFVQDASHELRTPLTIARGHLEVALLPYTADPREVQAAVELAVAELDRMGRLVNSLLALARAEGGGGGGTRTRVEASRLAELSVERSRPLAEREWRLSVAQGAGTWVMVDPDAVEQVLLNLLANAVRHTASGGQIDVAVRRDRNQVEIDVTDDGEGIPQDALPTLFDRFARVDGARGRASGGAGLGLAICRTIVESHGGSIRAESEPGHGARFVIRLPATA